MLRKKLKVETGKTYTVRDATSTYTIIVGDLSEAESAPESPASESYNSFNIGSGAPSLNLGKLGSVYLDSLNKTIYTKDAIGWDSGFAMGGSDGSSEFKVGVGAPSLNLSSSISTYIDMQSMTFHTRSGGSWDEGRLMRGSSGQNGKSVRFGSGPPIASLGADDEAYIDLSDFKIHTKAAGSWSSGQAFKGSNGQNGLNGKSLRFGSGLPSDSDGDDDEVYLDLSNFKIHSKSAGSWGSGSEFKGNRGNDGQNGKSVRFGNGAPASSLGDDDETYIDLDSFKIHSKSAGSWGSGHVFKGSDGAHGLNGKSIKFGNGAPSDADGDDDEVYLDLSSFKVHTKATGSWNSGLAFKGSNGDNGTDGQPGSDGKHGVSAQLTNDSDVISADSDGSGYDFTDTGGEFEIRSGGTKVTSGVTYYAGTSGTSTTSTVNGLTLTINSSGAYSLSGASWTQNFARFTMRAIHDSVTYTKVYKVTKARAGLIGSNGQDGLNGSNGQDGLNGSNGLPGNNGKDGADGTNGKKVVTSSALSLSGSPVGATSYGCEVGDTLIDTVNHKVYTRASSSTWTLNGSSFKGAAGESSLIGQLTKEVAVIPANSSGIVTAENLTALGGGYFKVYSGKTDVTSACTFSIPGGELSGNDYIAYIDELQLNLNRTTGRFVLSGATWNADSTSFTMQATYSGSAVTKIYNVTKSKTGPGIKVYCVALGSDSSTSDVQLTTSYKDMYLADVITSESNILTAVSSKSATTFTINESGRYKIELQAAFRVKNVTRGSTYSAVCSAQILKNGVAPAGWSSSTDALSAYLAGISATQAAYASSAITISKTVFLAAGTTLKMQAKTSTTSGGTSYLELATDSETQSAEDTILTITKL
jgi:hypothetical protein